MKENDLETPLISIIVPVHNVEKYVRECLESIIHQEFEDYEVIVINDGSTDGTLGICKELEQSCRNMILIDQENRGVSATRNRGVSIAKGKYLMFVDSDDWLEKGTLKLVAEKIREYDADLIGWNFYYNYKNKQVKRKAISPEIIERNGKELQNFQYDMLCYNYDEIQNGCSVSTVRAIWNKAYRAEIIKKNNIVFPEALYMYEDAMFNMTFFEYAQKAVCMNEYLYHYRAVGTSSCGGFRKNRITTNQLIFKEIQEFISRHKKDEQFQKMYNLYVVECISLGMQEYFFHKDNPAPLGKRIKELKLLLKEEPYFTALRNVDVRFMTSSQKVLCFFAKMRAVRCMYLWQSVKAGIQNIKGQIRD